MPAPINQPQPVRESTALQKELLRLRKRIAAEATCAIQMLENALDALWSGDHDQAAEVRVREQGVDAEEVKIEQECFRIMTLHQPFAHDFRVLAFCLKVNQDLERVADHASSIAKITRRMDKSSLVQWPTAVRDMGDRVPVMCHDLLRAVLSEDVQAAREMVEKDQVIDSLDKRLFAEVREWIINDPSMVDSALLAYRVGRELERVGDLMVNIAEDLVYLVTGTIVRHSKVKTH